MSITLPRIVVLDTSTISNLSANFWGADSSGLRQARSFFDYLKSTGTLVGLTLTHVGELLRHEQALIARDRIRFLKLIPLIAWIRPCSGDWFVGSLIDVVAREIDLVIKNLGITWLEVVQTSRQTLWEHGTGSEMFNEQSPVWPLIRRAATDHLSREQYVESMCRSRDEQVLKLTLGECRKTHPRLASLSDDARRHVAHKMSRDLKNHGDKRLQQLNEVASEFTQDSYNRMLRIIAESSENWIERLAESFDIPAAAINDNMTVEELGDLGTYTQQLRIFSKYLRLDRPLSVLDVPFSRLPSYVVQIELERRQWQATRVKGSDSGDRQIAPLTLYADFVDLDKKTSELLRQVKLDNPNLAELMGSFGRVRHTNGDEDFRIPA
jgi:hypothetical protein